MRLCYINYSLLYNKLFPNLSKQQVCIISVWGQEFEHSLAECLCFKVCHQTTLKVEARDGVSSEGSTRGSFASKLTKWLLAGFRCSQAIGLRASASHWLLACGLLQFLAMRATAQTSSQPGSWPPSEQVRVSEGVQDGSHGLSVSWTQNSYPIVFALLKVEANHQA